MAITKKAQKSKKINKAKNNINKKPASKSRPAATTGAKHPGGRPALFKNVRDLQEKIDEYFESCWVDKVVEVTDKAGNVTATNSRYQNRPYTVMGLVLALGFTCRKQLKEYKAKPEFTNTINKARSKIEMNVEEYLIEGKNAAGPIFWLKNNAEEKYRDKQELEHSGPDGGPIRTKEMSDEELLAIASGGSTRASKKA